mgnify:CR=1 FL=1
MNTKVPFYNILNMFLVGAIFIVGTLFIYSDFAVNLIKSYLFTKISAEMTAIITTFVFGISYEVGYVINRIGSVVFEELLKKFNLVPYNDDYKMYNKAKKEYPVMDILSREYASSRTNTVLFLIIALMAILKKKCIIALVAAMCVVLFFLSCRKFAKKITILLSGDK